MILYIGTLRWIRRTVRCEVAEQASEGTLVGVVLFPCGEVPDMAACGPLGGGRRGIGSGGKSTDTATACTIGKTV